MEESKVYRLEDFIIRAKHGQHIEAVIDLMKKTVRPTVHPGETEDTKSNVDMYLLLGEYNFKVADEVQKVLKSYAFGTSEQSQDLMAQNIRLANERLKMDYERLKEVKIKFEEKFF